MFEPQSSFEHTNAVDVAPTRDNRGRMFLVDRGGNVTAFATDTGDSVWSYQTEDLSGLLSKAFLHREHIVFASLDGDLRALNAKTGSVAWSMPALPTEVAPVKFDKFLAIATTDNRLCVVDLDSRSLLRYHFFLHAACTSSIWQ